MVMTPYARVGDMLWTVAQSRAPKYLCARDMWRSPCLKLSARVRAPGNEDRACEGTLETGRCCSTVSPGLRLSREECILRRRSRSPQFALVYSRKDLSTLFKLWL